MKLSAVVAQVREYCPSFAGRVAGGIDFDAVATSTQLSLPAAYVVATGDTPSKNDLQNGIRQNVRDEFDVVVVLDSRDERGQAAVDLLHDVRRELWRALLGWRPDAENDPIEYAGGELVVINRNRVIYRYSFTTAFGIGRTLAQDPPETWVEFYQDGLPGFTGVTVRMDCIDPADPNLQKTGPDGRTEALFSGDITP